MPIKVTCDCGRTLALDSKHAGKRIRCPECREAVQVPAAAAPKASQKTQKRQPQRSSPRRPEKPKPRPKPKRRPQTSRSKPRRRRSKKGFQVPPAFVGAGIGLIVLGAAYYFLADRGETPSNVAATESDATASQTDNGTSAPLSSERPDQAAFKPKPTDSSLANAKPVTRPPAERPRPAPIRMDASYQAAIDSEDDLAYVTKTGSGFLRKDNLWYRLYEPERVSPGRQMLEERLNKGVVKRNLEVTEVVKPTTKVPVQVNLIRADSEAIQLYCPTSQSLFTLAPDDVGYKQQQFEIPPIRKSLGRVRSSGFTVINKRLTGGIEWSSEIDSVPWINELPQAWAGFDPEAEPANLKELIARAEQSVVRVDVLTTEGAGHGSGFLIDGSGLIATNYHVVEDAIEVGVFYKNGQRFAAVGVVHLDAKRDLAIIRAHVPSGYFPGLPLADTLPEKGEQVLAFGAPLGLSWSATEGMISALRDGKDLDREGTWVQTTAAISPGNSGGPLVTHEGRVVGLNTMTLVGGQALNFAIGADSISQAVLLDKPLPISPDNVPRRISKAAAPVEKYGDVAIVDLEGRPEAQKQMAEMSEVRIEIDVTADRQIKGAIEEICLTTAEEALADCNVKVVIDEGPVLFIIARVTGTRMDISGHLYTGSPNQKGEGVTINRLWRNARPLGNLKTNMVKNRKLTGSPKTGMRRFYEGLQKAFLLAQSSKKSDK